MTESTLVPQKHDRLTAFLKAFGLRAIVADAAVPSRPANLFVTVERHGEGASQILFHALPAPPPEGHFAFVAAATVDFGGLANPLVGTLPEKLVFQLADYPAMQGLADLFVAEVQTARCGGQSIQDRLCEVIVVLAIRRAIDAGTANAGLLAGLAHPGLHRCLVAIHDDPARHWRVEDLAALVGLSRSHFVAQFCTVVGQTPGAYLTGWRLALGRSKLIAGQSVKVVAGEVGFGSAAAFSRAFSRQYGHPPVRAGISGTPDGLGPGDGPAPDRATSSSPAVRATSRDPVHPMG